MSEFGHFELVQKFLHPFRLNLRQIGLLHVVHGESLDKGDYLHSFLLLLAHCTVFFRADAFAVLVLHHHVPIDHGKGLLTFQYMGFEIVRLLEGQIDRQAVAHGRRLQLEEERVGAGVVPSAYVLGQSGKA